MLAIIAKLEMKYTHKQIQVVFNTKNIRVKNALTVGKQARNVIMIIQNAENKIILCIITRL